MKCPRCSQQTQQMNHKDVTLDVCFNGCGGIWFDNFELKKMDEAHEADPEFIAKLSQRNKQSVDGSKRLNCPKCELKPDCDRQPMLRHFWSVKQEVEIDECPRCGSVWLDAGELSDIHALFSTEAEKKQAARELFEKKFGQALREAKKESLEKHKNLHGLAHALRFLRISYYFKK